MAFYENQDVVVEFNYKLRGNLDVVFYLYSLSLAESFIQGDSTFFLKEYKMLVLF